MPSKNKAKLDIILYPVSKREIIQTRVDINLMEAYRESSIWLDVTIKRTIFLGTVAACGLRSIVKWFMSKVSIWVTSTF